MSPRENLLERLSGLVEMGHAASPGFIREVAEDAILALAATPTPPTLSEDLREALHKQVSFVVERCSNHGVLACSVMLDPTQAKWLDAALAQVKASTNEGNRP